MKSVILALTVVIISGCAVTSYRNEYSGNKMRSNDEYIVIDPNVSWQNTYEDGCPVSDFYKQFKYDEIVDVSITEKVSETKLFALVISKLSICTFYGTGVMYGNPGEKREKDNVELHVSPVVRTPVDEETLSSSSSFEEDSFESSSSVYQMTPEEIEKARESARKQQESMKRRIEAAKARSKEHESEIEDLSSYGSDANYKRN